MCFNESDYNLHVLGTTRVQVELFGVTEGDCECSNSLFDEFCEIQREVCEDMGLHYKVCVWVCVCVCVCVCVYNIIICLYYGIYVNLCVRVYVYVHVYMYVHFVCSIESFNEENACSISTEATYLSGRPHVIERGHIIYL